MKKRISLLNGKFISMFFDRESNLARSYKFENCCSWGHFAQVPIFYEPFNYFMNSQNIGMIHKILGKFTKYWKISQNIGIIYKILEKFPKYWNDSQNI